VEENKGLLFSQIAQSLIHQLDKDMHTRLAETGFFANLIRIRGAEYPLAQKRELLGELVQRHPTYAWIGLTDAAGRIVAGTNGMLEGADVADAVPRELVAGGAADGLVAFEETRHEELQNVNIKQKTAQDEEGRRSVPTRPAARQSRAERHERLRTPGCRWCR